MGIEGLAVVIGIDHHVTVQCHDADPTQLVPRVHLSHHGPQGRVIDVDAPDNITARMVSLVYRTATGELGNTLEHFIGTVIESDLDDTDGGAKYGLRSSGTATVAATHALGTHFDLELNSLNAYRIATVAMLLADAADFGDNVACSTHGGVVLCRRPSPTVLTELVTVDAVAIVAAPWLSLRIDVRISPGGLQLLID